MSANVAADATSVPGSPGSRPKSSVATKRDAHAPIASPATMPGADEQRHASQHEADHRPARRAERHANADFGLPEAHRIRRHAIEAHSRHHQRQEAE